MKHALAAFVFFAISLSAVADLKSSGKMTVAGQSFNTTVLIKQGKIRNETSFMPGFSTVTIQDCSGRRIIQLNERAHTYLITELDGPTDQESLASKQESTGTVSLNVSEQDTGERRQFFGYSARHIKGTLTSEGGSGSCRVDFHAVTDGWYIDLPATQGCAPEREALRTRMERNGCNERMVVKVSGVEKLGYPVLIDTTMNEKQGSVTVHQETTDLTTASLDPALFEIPAGYSQVKGFEELAGFTTSSMTGAVHGQQAPAPPYPTNAGGRASENANSAAANSAAAKKKGAPRIGVTLIGSSIDRSISTEGLAQQLVNDINFLGGEGVLISSDPHDREAALEQAKQQGCDYVVFTTINNFKAASVGQRLGGVLNRGGLGGVGGAGQGRVELNAEVKVFQPDSFTPVIDGDVNFRQNDADATARGLMQTEARNVMLQVKKLQSQK